MLADNCCSSYMAPMADRHHYKNTVVSLARGNRKLLRISYIFAFGTFSKQVDLCRICAPETMY